MHSNYAYRIATNSEPIPEPNESWTEVDYIFRAILKRAQEGKFSFSINPDPWNETWIGDINVFEWYERKLTRKDLEDIKFALQKLRYKVDLEQNKMKIEWRQE